MNEADKDWLQRHHMKLREQLASNLSYVLDYLWSHKIITKLMKQRIEKENLIPEDKASNLLFDIRTLGADAYQALYDAARTGDLFEAADILRPANAPHAPSYEPPQKVTPSSGLPDDLSEDEGLFDSWPPVKEEDLRKLQTVRLKTFKDSKIKTALEKKYENSCKLGQKDYYPLTHKKRGLCLIFSNENFQHLEERKGNQKDMSAADTLFSGLGFDCFMREDLTSEEMEELIKTKVVKEDHSNSDCFVLVILSHGAVNKQNEDVVFGTDGQFDKTTEEPLNCVKVDWIKEIVCSIPSLQHKPKLFFIQACRGKKHDKGLSAESSPGTKQETGKEKTDFAAKQSDYVDGDEAKQSKDSVDANRKSTPTYADLYVSFSTIKGYVSYRNTKIGTWYFQAVAWVFSRFAYQKSIHELMTKVEGLLTSAKEENQVCESGSTLRRSFYFFPGLSKED